MGEDIVDRGLGDTNVTRNVIYKWRRLKMVSVADDKSTTTEELTCAPLTNFWVRGHTSSSVRAKLLTTDVA